MARSLTDLVEPVIARSEIPRSAGKQSLECEIASDLCPRNDTFRAVVALTEQLPVKRASILALAIIQSFWTVATSRNHSWIALNSSGVIANENVCQPLEMKIRSLWTPIDDPRTKVVFEHSVKCLPQVGGVMALRKGMNPFLEIVPSLV